MLLVLVLLLLLAGLAGGAFATCSLRTGYDLRCVTLINDKLRKHSPGTALPYSDEKKRSKPYVCLPAFVTTT